MNGRDSHLAFSCCCGFSLALLVPMHQVLCARTTHNVELEKFAARALVLKVNAAHPRPVWVGKFARVLHAHHALRIPSAVKTRCVTKECVKRPASTLAPVSREKSVTTNVAPTARMTPPAGRGEFARAVHARRGAAMTTAAKRDRSVRKVVA